jgi:hypothetical protein
MYSYEGQCHQKQSPSAICTTPACSALCHNLVLRELNVTLIHYINGTMLIELSEPGEATVLGQTVKSEGGNGPAGIQGYSSQ